MTQTAIQESPAVHPVELFASQVIALEAALLRTAAVPSTANVHHLRTHTRRMEAQLELLSALPELRGLLERNAKPLRQVRRALRSIRREAGRVRDMDVQIGQLEKLAGSHLDTPVGKQANLLVRELRERREDEAGVLTGMLNKHTQPFVRHLESLREALDDASELTVTAERLHDVASAWYAARAPETPAGADGSTKLDEDQLHDARKSAKLARYLLEAKAPGVSEEAPSDAVKQRAAAFERLQGAGGEWHDLLTLAELARDFHGKKSELAQHLVQQRDGALSAYLGHLRSFA